MPILPLIFLESTTKLWKIAFWWRILKIWIRNLSRFLDLIPADPTTFCYIQRSLVPIGQVAPCCTPKKTLIIHCYSMFPRFMFFSSFLSSTIQNKHTSAQLSNNNVIQYNKCRAHFKFSRTFLLVIIKSKWNSIARANCAHRKIIKRCTRTSLVTGRSKCRHKLKSNWVHKRIEIAISWRVRLLLCSLHNWHATKPHEFPHVEQKVHLCKLMAMKKASLRFQPQELRNAGHDHKYFDIKSRGISNLITELMPARTNYWTFAWLV